MDVDIAPSQQLSLFIHANNAAQISQLDRLSVLGNVEIGQPKQGIATPHLVDLPNYIQDLLPPKLSDKRNRIYLRQQRNSQQTTVLIDKILKRNVFVAVNRFIKHVDFFIAGRYSQLFLVFAIIGKN